VICLASGGCAALVGIQDFTSGSDAGPADGSVVSDAALDGSDSAPDVATGHDGGAADVTADGAPDAAANGGGCVTGAQRCSTTAGQIDTCDANGQWTLHWQCVSGACQGGACTDPANPPTTATSCQAPGDGRDNCGDGGESCCTSLEVPGGTFYREYANNGDDAGDFDAQASVSNFRLDKYDVTVGRYRLFLDVVLPDAGAGWVPDAGAGVHAHLYNGQGLSDGKGGHEPGWDTADNASIPPTTTTLQSCNGNQAKETFTPSPQGNERLPMTCVSWYEVYAFCIWDGAFLPSQAEWGYAAAGGSQQRQYPWGPVAPGSSTNYAIYNCNYGPAACANQDYRNIAPVGLAYLGVARWGQLDLTSNVNQYLFDAWDGRYEDINPCIDCANDDSSVGGRAVFGGNFSSAAIDVQSAPRSGNDNGAYPAYPSGPTGFRCARVP
jgi:sulfatase modifying factor 1